ncbi:MAG TPA: PDZ domain-containing protein [Vicinamibacterales bacterium]|nr:PDZ domain-containing protein [Vicinamibacterales bacterium]
MRAARAVRFALLLAFAPVSALAQEVSYRVSFPQPEHRWLQVEATFTGVRPPLELRMSRASPGRYALHEFAKNVYDVRAVDRSGAEIPLARPDPYGWTAMAFDGPLRVTYKVFGNHVDGTYLAVDGTHAHMNMPAVFMWARGATGRPVHVTFVPPPASSWRVATQLFPTSDPWTFTAPNLQYFMDSPTEMAAFWEHTFTVPQPAAPGSASFRIALHHEAGDAGARMFAAGVERIAAEHAAVFGEFPAFEPGHYTFLADYLAHARGDGMEHRNSTVLTGRSDLSQESGRIGALATVAHELFHAWNVERIRPASLEPFDFERANMSSELWIGEGFTSYYEALVMQRAGLASLDQTLAALGGAIDLVVNAAGRHTQSVVEMSRMAPFVDAASFVDENNFHITFVSYYTWGAALALGLDLSLRDLSGGRVTLDDFMRAMWREHGRPGGPSPGLVARPYSLDDARDRLAEISGDRAFADAFFARYVYGHEVPDYARLLERAGLVLRPRHPGRAWLGELALEWHADGARVSQLVDPGAPAYAAGIERDDVITSVGRRHVAAPADLEAELRVRKPGDTVAVQFLRRGATVTADVRLAEDPSLELVTMESTGARLSAAQERVRSSWLSAKAANAVMGASSAVCRASYRERIEAPLALVPGVCPERQTQR